MNAKTSVESSSLLVYLAKQKADWPEWGVERLPELAPRFAWQRGGVDRSITHIVALGAVIIGGGVGANDAFSDGVQVRLFDKHSTEHGDSV